LQFGLFGGSVSTLPAASRCKVIIVDDVITAGTAIRSVINQLERILKVELSDLPQLVPVAVFVVLDREETASETTKMSAVQVRLKFALETLRRYDQHNLRFTSGFTPRDRPSHIFSLWDAYDNR
jgi:orotate phosphoribosyltransferase